MHLRDTIQPDPDTRALIFWRRVEKYSTVAIWITVALSLALIALGVV